MTRWITWAALLVLAAASCRKESDTAKAPVDKGGIMLMEPADSASVAAGAISFAWRAVPRATSYRFELRTQAGAEAIPPQDTFDTTITVPVLEAGAYRWLVVAALPDGGETPSQPRNLRITVP